MDVSFFSSSKPHSLTATLRFSCFSLSSSSSFTSPRFRVLRKEYYFGSCHRLRPPDSHSRRKCKKLGFQIQPSKFIIRASLSSQLPIVVIFAVATISALTVIYLDYSRRRRAQNSEKFSGPKDPNSLGNHQLSKQKVGFAKQENGSTLELKILDEETHMREHKPVTKIITENGHAYQESLVENQETKASELHGSDFIASRAGEHTSMKQTEAMGLAFPSPALGQVGPQLVHEMHQLSSETHQAEDVLYHNLSRQIVETKAGTSTIPAKDAHAGTQGDEKKFHVTGDAHQHHVSGYTGFFGGPVREEIHTFYKEHQPGGKLMSTSMDLKVVVPRISEPGRNTYSSLLRSSVLNRAELSAVDSHTTTDCLEQEMPLGCYGDVSSRKRRNFAKEAVSPSDTGKRLSHQDGERVWPIYPQPNGIKVNGEHDPSKYLSTYNRLVRDGRLSDCVKLLQSMEQMGLLDMDKVYHARFFNACKSQKAVKEALSFTKLIPNPSLSTFNMLLSVCASSQDSEGAFQVVQFVKEAGLKADCKLYTTLISTCAKSGKVDAMFKVFHEMVNAGVEPNVHTYGALIDGCARAGQVAKAFGAYGILRSKNVKPDRVVFNALITACGQSGAVDRAFDVLAEMRAEPTPIDPDHVTVGALIKTCAQSGQLDRAREVYRMIHQYNIKGTPEVYTVAVNSCSQIGDLDFALAVYDDMKKNGVYPDEMCLSALITTAGNAGKLDVAFKVVQEAKTRGTRLGNISYSSLMGACSNAKDWQRALELYADIKTKKLRPTVSTLNALITALCDGDQLKKAVEVLDELKKVGVRPNTITYSILFVACEKKDEPELGSMLHSLAKRDGVLPNLVMCGCLIGMCLRRFQKAYSLGEPVLSLDSGKSRIDSEWTTLALKVYREMITGGVLPTTGIVSQVLGCLQFPLDTSVRTRLTENLGLNIDASKCPNLLSLIDGFGEYDTCSFSLLEEAASLGVLPGVSFKQSPIVVDARELQIHTAEVYLLTVLKGLRHRLAAGAKLPNVNILVSVEKTQVQTPNGEKTINLVGRVGQAVAALLRRLGLSYQGNESYGKIRINGLSIKRWLQPKLDSPLSGKPSEFNSSQTRLGKGIMDQQRNIRTANLSLE